MIRHLPNLISLARLLAVPLNVIFMIKGNFAAGFWIFVAAGISDGVDGALARQFNARTRLGRYLDPLADKTLLVSVYVVLGMQELLPAWLVVIVVFRDLLIIGGALLFFSLQSGFEARPILISKVNTVAQIALAGWLLAVLGIDLADHGVTMVLVWVVAATTVASGAAYLWNGVRRLDEAESGR
jgi:cardiolipin synthase